MIWACASECSSSFSGQCCSNLRIGSDIFRSQLLAVNKVLSAVLGTRHSGKWGVCLKGNLSLYIFRCVETGLSHPPGKTPSISDSTVIMKFSSLDGYYEVFVSSHPSRICPWTAHCLTSLALSNSVIHFLFTREHQEHVSEETVDTIVFSSFNPAPVSVPRLYETPGFCFAFFFHLFYCCLSMTTCPSVVTVGVHCFDFQVGNLTVIASVFIVPLDFMFHKFRPRLWWILTVTHTQTP